MTETPPSTYTAGAPVALPDVVFSPDDRVLILAPHPDDEALACAGVIRAAVAQGVPVHLVYLTYGDNNEWSYLVYRRRLEILPGQMRALGETRHAEALRSAAILGLPEQALAFLGYPDFGTLHIWGEHWAGARPYRSMLTRATAVPYHDAYRPGAAYTGEEIVRDLQQILADVRPTRVFVSHPADHNPDHQALYLFLHIALWELPGAPSPTLHPYLTHYPHWPHPRGLDVGRAIAPPPQLGVRCRWQVLRLDEDERARKLAAIEAHATQFGYARQYLESFVGANELYGDFDVARLRHASDSSVSLGSESSAPPAPPPEQLEDEERERFVGLESHTVKLVADALQVAVGLSRPLGREVTLNLHAFGWRSDRPFAAMPKLRVEVGALRHRVTDQGRGLRDPGVSVRRSARTITAEVALEALGQPERVFLAAATRLGELPLSVLPWRILDLGA